MPRGSHLFGAQRALRYSDLVMSKAPDTYWKLNETSGTTFFDSSGHNHPLSIEGSGANPPLLAQPSLAPGLDGTSTTWRDDYTADVWGVDWLSASRSEITAEFWMRTSLARLSGSDSVLLSNYGGNNAAALCQFQLNATDGHINWEIWDSSSVKHSLPSPGSVCDGNVHYIAGTFKNQSSGSGVNFKLYVDGTPVASQTLNVNLQQTGYLFYLTSLETFAGYYYKGDLQAAAVYPTAHTDADIAARWAKANAA